MKYIIDRFENDIAVCEDETKTMIEIPIQQLPTNAKSGDILSNQFGYFEILEEETKIRREEIRKKMQKLFE